jgi:hypothetical protein
MRVVVAMFRHAVLIALIAMAPVAQADGPICGPHPMSWDKEHALIEEADLTPEEVKKAKAWIERAKHPPPNPPGEMEMLAGAGENIIEGYKLKREYERHPSTATKQKFCKWMATDAFWPE